jgi:hypothetical protein
VTVALVGEVMNTCDSTAGFSTGNISTDDEFVQGTGAIGAKTSGTYRGFFTTTFEAGASNPYDFSVGASEEGYHFIMYFGAKSPLQATAGQRIIVGNGTDQGEWYVPLSVKNEPKIAVFTSRVVDMARDFDLIQSGTWTLAGNPAQLTSISEVGGGLETIVTIMGNFNNTQVDQMTIGLGVRADAGSTFVPNTFEAVRVQDEDNSKWGWFSSVVGAIVAKGKLFIGPVSGSTVSVFTSTDETVIYAPELVASDFYEIETRGAGTDVSMTRLAISSADPAVARWRLTVDSTTLTFADTDGVWKGSGELALDATTTLTNTVFGDCTHMTQNGATLVNCKTLEANTSTGVEFVLADDPGLISDCSFAYSSGHAIRCDTVGTYSWSGNSDSGYTGARTSNLVASSGSNEAMFYNNSGGLITLNVIGGGQAPGGIRNGAFATTVVNNAAPITITITDNSGTAIENARVEVSATETAGSITTGDVLLTGLTDVSGVIQDAGFNYEGAFDPSGLDVKIKARQGSVSPFKVPASVTGAILPAGLTITIALLADE